MKLRYMIPAFSVALFAIVVVLQAGGQSTQPPPSTSKDELAIKEKQLADQFGEFQLLLLKLKQRMERGTDDEKNRAKAIGRILEEVQKGSIKIEFDQLADLLRESKLSNPSELGELAERAAKLTDKLRDLINMLQDDPRRKQLAEERKILEHTIKMLGELIKKEQQLQALTEADKTDKRELAQNQNKIAKNTNDLTKTIDKFLGKGENVAQDAKNLKGGPKDAGKEGSAKAETKDDGEQSPKVADQGKSKDGGDKKGENVASAKGDENPKQGDSQAKQGEGAQASAKDPKKSGDSQGSQAKNNEGAKGNEAGSKNNEGAKGKEATAKAGDKTGTQSPKDQSQAKAGDGNKQGGPKDSKDPQSAQAGQPKSSQGSPQAQSKPSPAQAKAGNDSKGQSQAKSDGAKDGPPSNSQASQSNPSQPQAKADHGPQSTITKEGDGSQQQQQQGNPKTKDELAKNQKKILEAGYEMVKAEHELIAGKKKPAVEKEQSAIDKLEEAKKKLEELLRQTREEELERLLAALEARCRKMLEMQIAVLAGTEQTHKGVLSRVDAKPAREDQQSALKLSDNEKDIIKEADKAIQMLEEEGSAVAFPEVFQQVREDMKHVQRRLEVADVGEVSQAIEKDIIASLKEMIEALKKAQQQGKAGKPGDPSPPPDQKLLDKIAELKMIRSLQKRINDRTQFYGRLYPNEQALDANIRSQLQQLAERQDRIFEIMDRFAKGDGK
jgi:hypothetical protein